MSTAIAIPATGLPAILGPDLAAAVDLARAEKAPSTRKAYGTDFRIFKAWCDAKGIPALPAAPVATGRAEKSHPATHPVFHLRCFPPGARRRVALS